jgi:hypothetical protein
MWFIYVAEYNNMGGNNMSTYCDDCGHIIVNGKPYWSLDCKRLLCINCMVNERYENMEPIHFQQPCQKETAGN